MDQAEIEEREVKIIAMESEIEKKCEEIDQKNADLDTKRVEVEKLMGLAEAEESFMKFFGLVNEICTLWIAKKGATDGLTAAVQKLIEAREGF